MSKVYYWKNLNKKQKAYIIMRIINPTETPLEDFTPAHTFIKQVIKERKLPRKFKEYKPIKVSIRGRVFTV